MVPGGVGKGYLFFIYFFSFLAVGVYFNKLLYSDKPSAYSWTLHTNIGQLDITMANE